MKSGRKWTADEDIIFDNLLAGGSTYEFTARALNRSVDALKARRKARDRIARGLGPKPGGQIKPRHDADYMLGGRRELAPNDDDPGHVSRCLNAGGFTTSLMRGGVLHFAARTKSGTIQTWRQP